MAKQINQSQVKKRTRVCSEQIYKLLNNLEADGYSGASNSTAIQGWESTYQSAVADNIPNLVDLRARNRDLVKNSPIGSAVINRKVNNVVGAGLLFQSSINRDVLNLTDDQAEEWEKDTENRFNVFARNKDIDIERQHNFYELADLNFRTVMTSGDSFVLMPLVEDRPKDNKLCLAIYEGDYVASPEDGDNSLDKTDSSKIAGGIEIDKNGAPKYAYFYKSHPGDSNYIQLENMQKIPFYGEKTGRRNILHNYFKTRPKQRRGIPILTPVLTILKQLTRYTEAELVATVINSFLTVFITKKTIDGEGLGVGSAYPTDGSETILNTDNPSDVNKIELGSGTSVELLPDEDIKVVDPSRPNKEFGDFFEAGLKQVGASLGIPFEVLMQYFSSSYSASRASLLEFWKLVTIERKWLITNFCEPIYEEWLTIEILDGRIKAPGFFESELIRNAWLGSVWNGTISRGMIDPLKETKASVERIKNNLSTYEKEFLLHDVGDWSQAMRRKAREVDLLESLGLSLLSDTDISDKDIEEEKDDSNKKGVNSVKN